MTEETSDLTVREILDFLLILPIFYAMLIIGAILIVVGKILDFVEWVRGGED